LITLDHPRVLCPCMSAAHSIAENGYRLYHLLTQASGHGQNPAHLANEASFVAYLADRGSVQMFQFPTYS
jgi:hypothetical protein